MPAPAYFLTWHTYGTWLHGDEAGSVDRAHNARGHPRLPPDPERFRRERASLRDVPLVLGVEARAAVDAVMRAHCVRREWNLRALAVRSNHVHVVLLSYSPDPKWANGAVDPHVVVKQLKEWGDTRTSETGICEGGSACVGRSREHDSSVRARFA